jgi:hypothetical protein
VSQTDRILDRLKMGRMCSLEPLDWTPRITRTAARIQDLKDRGTDIVSEPCLMHFDKTAAHVVYNLATSDQMELFV